jgi:hypothetical protein
VAVAAVSLGVSFALCLSACFAVQVIFSCVFATFKRLEIALWEKEADGTRKLQADLRSLVTGNIGKVGSQFYISK